MPEPEAKPLSEQLLKAAKNIAKKARWHVNAVYLATLAVFVVICAVGADTASHLLAEQGQTAGLSDTAWNAVFQIGTALLTLATVCVNKKAGGEPPPPQPQQE